MNGAIARIILRYVVGALLVGSHEVGTALATDPDVVLIVAGLIGAGTEGVYWLARRRGWAL